MKYEHLGDVIDKLETIGKKQNSDLRKANMKYWFSFLDALIDPVKSGYFQNYLNWAVCLPVMIPAYNPKQGACHNHVKPLVYYGPQKHINNPSMLPFTFEGNHMILTCSHSRLWIWGIDNKVTYGTIENVILVYKRNGAKRFYVQSKPSSKNANSITELHMKDFFESFESEFKQAQLNEGVFV